eukprot:4005257-Prymnesium_polylepis.1
MTRPCTTWSATRACSGPRRASGRHETTHPRQPRAAGRAGAVSRARKTHAGGTALWSLMLMVPPCPE